MKDVLSLMGAGPSFHENHESVRGDRSTRRGCAGASIPAEWTVQSSGNVLPLVTHPSGKATLQSATDGGPGTAGSGPMSDNGPDLPPTTNPLAAARLPTGEAEWYYAQN